MYKKPPARVCFVWRHGHADGGNPLPVRAGTMRMILTGFVRKDKELFYD